MKRKNGIAIVKNLQSIWEELYAGLTPTCVESDLEGGVISNETRSYFKRKDIYLHEKYGENKAHRAEYSIW